MMRILCCRRRDCRDLRHEAYLYYQRYLSAFVLEEYDAVERDTTRNLRVVELCERYAAREADRRALQLQRAYVLMMQIRAKTYQALQNELPEIALRLVDQGLNELALLDGEDDEEGACARELKTLRSLREEVLEKLPEQSPARLRLELQQALAEEDYEEAARIRDLLTEAVRAQTG